MLAAISSDVTVMGVLFLAFVAIVACLLVLAFVAAIAYVAVRACQRARYDGVRNLGPKLRSLANAEK